MKRLPVVEVGQTDDGRDSRLPERLQPELARLVRVIITSVALLTSSLAVTGAGEAQTFDLLWTRIIEGSFTAPILPSSMATDKNGNVYVLSRKMLGTVDFDPGPGSDIRSDEGVFLTRINANGSYGWTRYVGGSFSWYEHEVSTADLDGNVYVVRYRDWPNGLQVYRFTPEGTLAWLRELTGKFHNLSVAADGSSHALIGGCFSGTINTDPGASEVVFQAVGESDIFVTELNPDGTHAWTRTIAGVSGLDLARVVADPEGNVFLAGSFRGQVDFDSGPGTDIHSATTAGSSASFLSRMNSDGTYAWTRDFGDGIEIEDACYGSDRGLYVTGEFAGTVDLDPTSGVDAGSTTLYSASFVSKYGSDGTYVWTRHVDPVDGSWGSSSACGCATDGRGGVYVAGLFWGDVDLDPGSGVDARTSIVDVLKENLFLSRLGPNAEYKGTRTLYGQLSENSLVEYRPILAGGRDGNCYLADFLDGIVLVDPGAAETAISGRHGTFLSQFGANRIGTVEPPFDSREFLERLLRCMSWSSGTVGVGRLERCSPAGADPCPYCRFGFSRSFTPAGTRIPDYLRSFYQAVMSLWASGAVGGPKANATSRLAELVKSPPLGSYMDGAWREELLRDVYEARTPTSWLLGRLAETLNRIELDLSVPELAMSTARPGSWVDLNGVAAVRFSRLKTPGRAGLAIRAGLPSSIRGYTSTWPVATYDFSFTGEVGDDGFIDIKIFIGGLSMPSSRHPVLFEWDGQKYRDITTHVDIRAGVVQGRTGKLGQYVVMGKPETKPRRR